MGLHAYRSNARGLPGCTWRLQKLTERAWARLALSIKRRNPGWRNIFLCGSVVLATGVPLALLVSLTFRLPATSSRSTTDPPGSTGQHASEHPDSLDLPMLYTPLCMVPFVLSYFPSLSFNGRNTSNYLLGRGCQRGVARVYYTLLRTLHPACIL